jgi:hypothetical protein
MGSTGHMVHSVTSRWVQCGFNKKCIRTHYAELVFLHPVGSVGHIVHSCTSGARNIDALFSCLGGPGAVSIKSALAHVKLDMCFCILWDLHVT